MPGVFDAHLRRRRTLVWALALAALAGVLAVTPLFDALGFEFAFALGIGAALAALDQAARFVRQREGTPTSLVALVVVPLAVTWLQLVPPLVIISLNAFRVRQCDWAFGAWCTLLLPVTAAAFGTLWGVVISLTLARRRTLRVAAAWLLMLASVLWGVARFASAPAIFGYDAFVGYFPGALYDEHISFSPAFFWGRLSQAAWALAALAAVAAFYDASVTGLRRAARRRGVLAAAAVLTALAIGLQTQLGRLGVAPDADDVARALGGRVETPHFVIHYPKDAGFADQIDVIAADHEFRYAQVVQRLGLEVPGKIHSFYFRSPDEKQQWMGARYTAIAKPWRNEIYLHHDDFPHGTLRHEIAHVVAGMAGDPLFHVSVSWWGWPPAQFNVGLIEGVAVAADWPAGSNGRLTPHQSVRAMIELERLPPIARLLAPGFFQFSAAQSYTTAGSFVYFLLQKEGRDKLHALFRAGGRVADFAAIYGRPLATLEAEWKAEVAKAPLAEEDLEIARERFRRRAIFSRPCPHAVAQRIEDADAHLARGDARGAVLTIQQICVDDPGEPGHVMRLAEAQQRAGDPDAALAAYASLFDDDGSRVSAPVRARALWRAADLEASRGRIAEAAALVDRALLLGVDEDTRRNLLVRRRAFAGQDPAAVALRRYLVPSSAPADDDAPTDGAPKDALAQAAALPAQLGALGEYLYARRLIDQRRWPEATAALERALASGLDEPLVRREATRLLLRAGFLAGDFDAVRDAARRASGDDQPLPVRLEAADWLERVAFSETGRLP